jgi:hypothetical protein
MLVELCCVCGFINRDDSIVIENKPYGAYKPHYHWKPKGGKLKLDDITYHATVCLGSCGDHINWEEFTRNGVSTPLRYRVSG